MAVVMEGFNARPVIVSSLAALVLHAAIVVVLPHARARHASDLFPHALEVDFNEVPAEPVVEPPLPDTPANQPPTGAGAGGPAAPAARAPLIVARPEQHDEPRAEPPFVSGDGDLPITGPVAAGPGADGGGPAAFAGPGSGSGPPGPPGPPAAAPPPPPPPSVDRSRAPALARGGQWSCPWPEEAEQIDDAAVTIRVVVDAAGHATRVDVEVDPGHGFAREARRCAMRETYLPGLDREGRPIAATSKQIRVRFSR